MAYRHGALLALAGGALVMVGSILPWASVASGFGQVDLVGTSGDGVIALGAGALVALIVFLSLVGVFRDRAAAGLILFLAGVGILALAITDLQGLAGKLTNTGAIRSSIGAGLYLVLVGGAVVAIGGVLAVRHRGEQEAPRPPAISLADELTKLAALRDAGVIAEEDFVRERTRLLSRT